jgi:hypothetical protein
MLCDLILGRRQPSDFLERLLGHVSDAQRVL